MQCAYSDVNLEKLQSHFLQGDEDIAMHFDDSGAVSHHILCRGIDNARAAMHASHDRQNRKRRAGMHPVRGHNSPDTIQGKMMADTPAIPADPNFVPIEGTLDAPIIYFEVCPTFGNNGGLLNLMLATGLIDSAPHGKVASRVKAVAHLRMTAAAAVNLRDTLNNALAMGVPVQKPEGRTN